MQGAGAESCSIRQIPRASPVPAALRAQIASRLRRVFRLFSAESRKCSASAFYMDLLLPENRCKKRRGPRAPGHSAARKSRAGAESRNRSLRRARVTVRTDIPNLVGGACNRFPSLIGLRREGSQRHARSAPFELLPTACTSRPAPRSSRSGASLRGCFSSTNFRAPRLYLLLQ